MRSRYLFAALIAAGLALVISLPTPADEAPSKEKIDKLIDQMGSGTFAEREKATKQLAAIGVPALDALRKAAKSEDAEVRKRAGEIVPKIEMQAESLRILAPKRVHLVYKDTPLREALADFQKKSGYNLQLIDRDGKLKERKITLDTGDTTFWHALELFCAKAELTEGTMQDLMQVPPPPIGVPGVRPVPLPPQRIKEVPIKDHAPPKPAKAPGLKAAPPAPAAPRALPAQAPPPAAPPRAQAVPAIAVIRPIRVGMPFMPGMPGQIILKDGKIKKLPTDDRSAVRVRALDKSDRFGKAPEGEMILPLEVTPEPKLQWQAFQSIRIDKAVDDQDQKLAQVVPQVQGGAGFNGAAIGIALPGAVARPAFARPVMWGGLQQQVPVQLKKGAKAAKSLKELKGVITAQLLTEERPIMTIAKLKAGETSKGDVGGSIKIVTVKSEEKQTTIRLEFEQPPFDKVVPAQPQMNMNMPGIGGPIRLPRRGVKILPAPAPPKPAPPGLAAQPPPPPAPPAQLQIQIRGGGGIAIGGPVQFGGASIINGLSIQDDKGNALPMQLRQTQIQAMQRGAIFVQTFIYTLVCQHDKDKGQPAKVVYLGRKRATVEIPFTLKDVPLP